MWKDNSIISIDVKDKSTGRKNNSIRITVTIKGEFKIST